MNNAKKQRKTVELERLERDLFKKKKKGNIKGILHARMGTIKDQNCKDMKKAEEIKMRWQEYTEDLYKKKVLMTQITIMV